MKRFKSCRAYGAFEYVIILALVLMISLIILGLVKNSSGKGSNILDKSVDALKDILVSETGKGDSSGGEVLLITVTYSEPFNYDYSKPINNSIVDYYRTSGFVEVRDKSNNIRTDYLLENISEVGEFFQVELVVDGEIKTEMRSINRVCYLATDSDFSGTTDGYFKYIGTFTKCVEIPHIIKGIEITSYEGMFEGTNVERVISRNENILNMEGMFKNIKSTNLDLSIFYTTNVQNMGDMFEGSNISHFDLSGFSTGNVLYMWGMFKNSKAESINFGSNFDTSNVIDMNGMFNNSEIKDLDLGNFNTEKVTNMWGMFAYSKARTINLSNFNTGNVTDMRDMFHYSQVESLDLLSFDTSKVTDTRFMFAYTKVPSLNLSKFNTENVINMKGMFKNSEIQGIEFGKDFKTSNTENMNNMFEGSKLLEINLSLFNFSKATLSGIFLNSETKKIIVGTEDAQLLLKSLGVEHIPENTEIDIN